MSATLPSVSPSQRRTAVWICVGLVVLGIAIFGQAVRFGFIAFDDDRYVDHNPALEAGLSLRGLHWAFTTNLTHLSESAEYWEPLTLLTRLADYQIFGFAPWGHHLTSVLLHLAAALALFGALQRLTSARWRSAIVAALFLVHPMHVEPVLWLSARKDLVNGLFFILTLWAYAHYAARPGWRRYLLVAAACLGANMGKPMAVSLPFVLLLLDFWPLRRWSFEEAGWPRRAGRLLWEKTPFFVLSFGVALLAFIVQKDIGALGEDPLPLPWRFGNAALACTTYLTKAVIPTDLAFFYPHPGRDLNVLAAAAAAVALVLISFGALTQSRRRPCLTVGWLWFLVVIAPVSGIVQIGDQALADRYSYLAFIGLFIAVVWQAAEWFEKAAHPRWGLVFAGGVLTVFSCLAFFQTRTWRDSETLFGHAIAVSDDNYLAHFNLAAVLAEKGHREDAAAHFAEARRIRAPFIQAQLTAAADALHRGAFAEAVPRLTRVLLLQPWDADLHQRLGTVLVAAHEPGKALVQFSAALKYRPDWTAPRLSISEVLAAEHQSARAEKILRDVLDREPGNTRAQELARTLATRGE